MFGRIGSGIVGGVSMICTYKYLKEQKKEKKDMEREINAMKSENQYLKKKIDKMENTKDVDDKEIREENLKFLHNFDTLMDVVEEDMIGNEEKFKKVNKKLNKAIEKNRKEIQRLLKEMDIDMD